LGRATTLTKLREFPPSFLQISSEIISLPLVSVEENKLIETELTVAVLNYGAGGLDGTVAALT